MGVMNLLSQHFRQRVHHSWRLTALTTCSMPKHAKEEVEMKRGTRSAASSSCCSLGPVSTAVAAKIGVDQAVVALFSLHQLQCLSKALAEEATVVEHFLPSDGA